MRGAKNKLFRVFLTHLPTGKPFEYKLYVVSPHDRGTVRREMVKNLEKSQMKCKVDRVELLADETYGSEDGFRTFIE